MTIEWDEKKNQDNIEKHHLTFQKAQDAFFDPQRLTYYDRKHSKKEKRYFCIGVVGQGIATVRFTMRNQNIRILGAGYWRDGRERYEQHNLH
jgi:uncharacterized DUF497 family protein